MADRLTPDQESPGSSPGGATRGPTVLRVTSGFVAFFAPGCPAGARALVSGSGWGAVAQLGERLDRTPGGQGFAPPSSR